MKKYVIILFAILFTGALNSCKDALDLPDDGRISYESIWADRNRTMGYLNACYGNVGVVTNESLEYSAYTSDAQSVQDNTATSAPMRWYTGIIGANNWILQNIWSSMYNGIRYCNVFINELPNATAFAQPDEKESWLAQAKCLRALYYYYLIRNYGPVVLSTEPFAFDHNFSADSRTPVWQIVQQILKDTEEALAAAGAEDVSATSIGFRWALGDNYGNMMHRALAYAIRSRAILLAVSPLHANEEGNPYTWEDAAKITKEALDQCLTHGYELFKSLPLIPTDAYNAYDNYFLTSYDWNRTKDKETIHGSFGVSIWDAYGLPTTDKQSSAGISPSQELVDCYETADGCAIIKQYNENHLRPTFTDEALASGYDDQNPYVNRDPRFYSTFYYNGALRHWDDTETVAIYDNAPEEESCAIHETLQQYTRTGYYIRKYNKHNSSYERPADGQIRMIRLAELYLNFAEAANEAYGPTYVVASDVSGSTAMSAVDAVNIVRNRADMCDVRSQYTTDADTFRPRIRNERRVEFAFEPIYFYDIRRWKTLTNGPTEQFSETIVTGMRATKNEVDGSFKYTRFVVSERLCNQEKYLLYPLPTNEVNKMFSLTGTNWQNPGYESPE
ncbi:MAG TPA: RagB/SusD family nutrient uptake outer membrane protein [Candidatus Alistipes merdigallinarum]|nr:RagB/SusD family nutrient uptake outer membrane protein [Candidatus Alistipes merdigallinarum]